MDLIFIPVSRVAAAVGPNVLTISMFCALPVISSEWAFVRTRFFALAVLKIISPLPQINYSIFMLVNSVAMSFVLNPVTIVGVSVCMIEGALAMCHVIKPVSFVSGAIKPGLNAIAFSLTTTPIPSVLSSAFINVCCPLLRRPVFYVDEIFLNFLLLK